MLSVLLATQIAAEPTQFSTHVLPIINRYCLMCHLPGAEQGDLSFFPDAHSALVGKPSVQSPLTLVKPGDPEGSYFYLKMVGTHAEVGGSGAVMPFQRDPLTEDELETIRRWIAEGALND